MNEQKAALEAKLADANARLEAEESAAVHLQKEKKQVEAEAAELKKQCQVSRSLVTDT